MVVQPALESLGACHDIVFLIDVAGIFSRGTGWKNQASTLIETFISAVAPGNRLEKWWKKAMYRGTLGLVSPQVGRVLFVATQVDRIHQDDRAKIKLLLEDLVHPAINYPKVKGYLDEHYSVAAAVESAESYPQHELRYFDHDGGKPMRKTVSQLPDEFPNDWNGGDYDFPRTAPRMPENRGNPPKQLGLDSITELLFSIRK